MHERVVVAVHAERPRGAAEHLDVARGVGLDPHGRVGLARVPQQRAQYELPRQATPGLRKWRTASISAGRSLVPSTLSERVTAASRRTCDGPALDEGVDGLLDRRAPGLLERAAHERRPAPPRCRRAPRAAPSAACAWSAPARRAARAASRCRRRWPSTKNARATSSTERLDLRRRGDDVRRLGQLAAAGVRAGQLLGHAALGEPSRPPRRGARASRRRRSRRAPRTSRSKPSRPAAIADPRSAPGRCARYQRVTASTSWSTPRHQLGDRAALDVARSSCSIASQCSSGAGHLARDAERAHDVRASARRARPAAGRRTSARAR